MGFGVTYLRKLFESIAKDNKLCLRISGVFITLILIIISGLIAYSIERTIFFENIILKFCGVFLLTISLASSIASRSLRNSVLGVINLVPDVKSSNDDLECAREKLAEIVGRDVESLDRNEIFRASAETASENAIDGIFAPIFWIFIGIILWDFSHHLPGPLTLVWIFKASSTIDSMIGYKRGRLKWLGTAGARLDDILTWIPCRLVLITLPFITISWREIPKTIKQALKEGRQDSSPNSGISEAIFANCIGIQMGGMNKYKNKFIRKPYLAINSPLPDKKSIMLLLDSIILLELLWVTLIILIINLIN